MKCTRVFCFLLRTILFALSSCFCFFYYAFFVYFWLRARSRVERQFWISVMKFVMREVLALLGFALLLVILSIGARTQQELKVHSENGGNSCCCYSRRSRRHTFVLIRTRTRTCNRYHHTYTLSHSHSDLPLCSTGAVGKYRYVRLRTSTDAAEFSNRIGNQKRQQLAHRPPREQREWNSRNSGIRTGDSRHTEHSSEMEAEYFFVAEATVENRMRFLKLDGKSE